MFALTGLVGTIDVECEWGLATVCQVRHPDNPLGPRFVTSGADATGRTTYYYDGPDLEQAQAHLEVAIRDLGGRY